MRPKIDKEVKRIIIEYLDDFEMPAKVYTFATGGCLVIDIISLFIYLILLGKYADAFFNLVQLFFVTAYFYLDIVYVLYLLHLRFRLPLSLRDPIVKALIGFGFTLRQSFNQHALGNVKDQLKNVFGPVSTEMNLLGKKMKATK